MAAQERQEQPGARMEEQPLLPGFEDECCGELQAEENKAERRFLFRALFGLGGESSVQGRRAASIQLSWILGSCYTLPSSFQTIPPSPLSFPFLPFLPLISQLTS